MEACQVDISIIDATWPGVMGLFFIFIYCLIHFLFKLIYYVCVHVHAWHVCVSAGV